MIAWLCAQIARLPDWFSLIRYASGYEDGYAQGYDDGYRSGVLKAEADKRSRT